MLASTVVPVSPSILLTRISFVSLLTIKNLASGEDDLNPAILSSTLSNVISLLKTT